MYSTMKHEKETNVKHAESIERVEKEKNKKHGRVT